MMDFVDRPTNQPRRGGIRRPEVRSLIETATNGKAVHIVLTGKQPYLRVSATLRSILRHHGYNMRARIDADRQGFVAWCVARPLAKPVPPTPTEETPNG